MKSLTVALVVAAALALAAALFTAYGAEAPHPAPNFALAGGKTLRSFRGQPVVIVIAPSSGFKLFRKEIANLEKSYNEFAAQHTIFVAVFTQPEEKDGPIRSAIPFIEALDGAKVAQACGITERFGVLVVGADGNADLITPTAAPAFRIRDAILNNGQRQAVERKAL